MKIQDNQFLSIEQLQAKYFTQAQRSRKVSEESKASFYDVLTSTSKAAEIASGVKFSKHAANRLAERNIELTQNQKERLQEGTVKAGLKGINESLVLVDQLAFIVNVPNNTVVTAMKQTETDENVFTNIDGAVII
ncbi:TIGR02530 family flagellar biosynthesis protein [Kineothrix sp. MB12-C1]|uniref:TIGR02530 family flagellar biosynthesis protein n=1 Tax=Kineothrix sp. MB12-C1 TaxID=3070215 RepID=UPI0027D2E581|nr:TIGR02530 family flagellar biosynthesis protein [Kineothrix sp. MB12-C1]WMC93013.1 TIGR02530 family flagellar biosynthesis protein [Kineothrix sp. MB12-C1]